MTRTKLFLIGCLVVGLPFIAGSYKTYRLESDKGPANVVCNQHECLLVINQVNRGWVGNLLLDPVRILMSIVGYPVSPTVFSDDTVVYRITTANEARYFFRGVFVGQPLVAAGSIYSEHGDQKWTGERFEESSRAERRLFNLARQRGEIRYVPDFWEKNGWSGMYFGNDFHVVLEGIPIVISMRGEDLSELPYRIPAMYSVQITRGSSSPKMIWSLDRRQRNASRDEFREIFGVD